MLHSVLPYWCLLLLSSSAMLSSASYLPHPTSQRVPDLHHLDKPFELDTPRPSPRPKMVKRFSDKNYASFYRLMARHGRYKDEQAFVEKMFRLFDMNSDQVIERDEFRAILQLLGIISHS